MCILHFSLFVFHLIVVMLYYLFDYLHRAYNLPGAGMFQYISFRAGIAAILSLLIATLSGKRIIGLLYRLQVGETVRDLGLEGQKEKSGTPTMGGIIIILALLIPVLLLTRLDNIYIILLIITTLWMGLIGFSFAEARQLAFRLPEKLPKGSMPYNAKPARPQSLRAFG